MDRNIVSTGGRSGATPAVTFDRVTERFGDILAVDNISMTIHKGCVYGFLGPNGAGKTTIIRMLMSILYPDSGAVTVLGNVNPEAVKDRLGYLPEERGLYKKNENSRAPYLFWQTKRHARSHRQTAGIPTTAQV